MKRINEKVAVFTSRQVLDGYPITRVFYNRDDFALEFYSNKESTLEEICVVSLGEILALDSSIKGLIDRLAVGEYACRDSIESSWRIFPL